MTFARPAPLLLLLGRVFWIILGPLLLLILVVGSFHRGNGWLTAADVAFLAILGGLILARWYEFQGGNPTTNMGEPATWSHFRRYVQVTIPLGLGVWIVANVIENHLLVP